MVNLRNQIARNKLKSIKMKKVLLIMIIALSNLYNAQTQIASIEFVAKCVVDRSYCLEDYNYVKDVNHLLDKYTGTWKGTLNGKNYEFSFVKKEKFESEYSNIKWDMLIGRVRITNQNGVVEYDDFNKSDNDANWGTNFQGDLKTYLMTFSGNKVGCNDTGYLYLSEPSPSNKMKIDFYQIADIVSKDCSNFQTTIPVNKIIYLTKQ